MGALTWQQRSHIVQSIEEIRRREHGDASSHHALVGEQCQVQRMVSSSFWLLRGQIRRPVRFWCTSDSLVFLAVCVCAQLCAYGPSSLLPCEHAQTSKQTANWNIWVIWVISSFWLAQGITSMTTSRTRPIAAHARPSTVWALRTLAWALVQSVYLSNKHRTLTIVVEWRWSMTYVRTALDHYYRLDYYLFSFLTCNRFCNCYKCGFICGPNHCDYDYS